MLSKKQYLYTLLIAVILFVITFIVTYFYMKNNSWNIETIDESTQTTQSAEVEKTAQSLYILPQTKIVLSNRNAKNKSLSETKLNASSLLGLTREEVAERFKDYTIETFNEKEVTLVKKIQEPPQKDTRAVTYVLGVEDNYVCIKEKDTTKRPVKIDYEVNHFSKYMYSLLLNEEIEITSAQKEALLLNPSMLQRILQGYVGE